MADQQCLWGRRLAVVALRHNRRRPIVERVDDIEATLRLAQPGPHIVVEIDGTRTIRRVRASETVIEPLPPVAPLSF